MRWRWWRAVARARDWLNRRRDWAAERPAWIIKTIDAVDRYYGRHIVWRLALRGWRHKQPQKGEGQWRVNSWARLGVLLCVAIPMVVLLFVWPDVRGHKLVYWLVHGFLGAVTGQSAVTLPAPEWRDLGPPLLALFGAPVAMLFWFWRDVHARATIENSRKDTNLKEFQEVQMRAAGALDDKLQAEARETLQVAAIHQLRGFIRGDYGAAFRRPAFELLRARLERSAIERGDDDFTRDIEALNQNSIGEMMSIRNSIQEATYNPRPVSDLGQNLRIIIADKLKNQRKIFNSKPLHRAEHQLLIEDWNRLFNTGLPFRGLNLSLVQFEPGTVFAGCHMPEVNLRGAYLHKCHFQGAYLRGAQLQGANLHRANLQDANMIVAYLQGAFLLNAQLKGAKLFSAQLQGATLQDAQLQGADLQDAKMQGADLKRVQLQGADLSGAHLQGANLRGAHLQGANLRGASIDAATKLSHAVYDDTTIFGSLVGNDPAVAEVQKAQWRAKGARHISEPSPFAGEWLE